LLFLTTNRIDDIDEAIVSRCIALIKFHPPNDEARRKIWGVMTDQFGLAVDAPLLDALVQTFPATSGRDIKGLAKLVAKYCQHRQVKPTLDVFERCAIFRGIDLGSAAVA
jgi:AAA+ superfamily predicted ATPase